MLAGSTLLLCVSACSGGIHRDFDQLSSTDLAIVGDQPVASTHSLPAGAYLVEVRERDIDFRVGVDAAGRHSESIDEVPRHGLHAHVITLAAPAELRVTVSNADHPSKRGSALVRIARWKRAPEAAPGELERGYVAYAAAGEQLAINTTESRTRAVDLLHEAGGHFEKAHDEAPLGEAQYGLGYLQYTRDEFAAAIRAADAAAEAFDADDAETGRQNAITLRAAAELELAARMPADTQRAEKREMFEAADRRLENAVEYFKTHALPLRAAYAVNMRGVHAHFVGDYLQAAKFFAQAVEMARANHDVGEEARSLANLAWVHNRLGSIAQAAREYEALLPLVDRERQTYQYAALLGNYGFCLVALGDFDHALQLHNEALQLFTTIGKQPERAIELSALGGLYSRVGDSERALETLQAAMVAHEQVGNAEGLAATLRMAGNTASSLDRHDLALKYLRRSAEIGSNPNSVARTQVLIAGELRVLGDLPAAESQLKAPLASASALVRASALVERAQLRLAQHQPEAALADLRAADREYAALHVEFDRIETNTGVSRLLLATGDVAGAAATADEAVAIATRIRLNSANPEWRARFLSSRYAPYEARIEVDLAAGGDRDQAFWRAFRTAEAVRARSLSDELAFGSRARQADASADALRDKLTAQQMRLETRMQRQGADDADTLELRRAIEETRAQIDASRKTAPAAGTQLADSLEALQAKLPADVAVLAYFVGDRATHGWLLTRNELRHASLPGRIALQSAVDRLVTEQRNARGVRIPSREFSQVLFGRLLDGVAQKRLLLIPDGPLHAAPLAALAMPDDSGQLVIDRFIVSYAPSLALALRGNSQRETHHTRVAVISDPVYSPDDRRMQLASSGPRGVLRSAPESTNKLTRLPYSSLEARAVVNAFGTAETLQLSGFDATPERVLTLPVRDLAVLHFATHAVARRDSPEQSALYLTEYTPEGALLPNSRLTASDIKRAHLSADVVVLSGCATGDGGTLRGEGVLGLTYGFLANGSRSVVAALWPIEDAGTARFMNEFYRAYRDSGRAAEALRVAQLRMRATTTPSVWSSFVVRANEFP